ncbi:iron chelate uptake ABC transporter family permease subunit [Streptomyces carpaticus]|uniref:FecCD family ABC transporter permease n=1 Tax=Streptomyces carpaticus TaxID=285558 RepID=UPI0021FBF8E9|nr:iron chelate uptake ABC transporter family permease subunit [Streptomyces carpaticus]
MGIRTETAAPSSRSRPMLAAGLVPAAAALVLAVAASLALGTAHIPLSSVWQALTAYDPGDTQQLIIREVRVPRTVIGVLTGVALGLAGAVMQAVARNPLADPGILGVNAGAALFVVVAINSLGLDTLSGYVWFGFAGALCAFALVYGVSSLGREGATPIKLALAGAATTAALGSITSAIILTSNNAFEQYRFWQVGALTRTEDGLLVQAAPFIAAGAACALLSGRWLNTLSLGDDTARALGQRVGAVRALAACAVVLLCGTATAIAGPIAFVGLVIPHIARAFTGPDYRWILPYSALLAPTLLLTADVVGRLIARPGELQVGIVTAVIGVPPFIALVRRRRTGAL